MIELIHVNHFTELNSELRQIYEDAFPVYERRNWSQLTELLANRLFILNEIYFGDQLIGLISFWNLDEFIFVEHFAIHESERSKGFGTQVINQLLHETTVPVILEVEMPHSEAARRRIKFYKHLKFKICSGIYFQPPYSTGQTNVEMLLMSYPEKAHPDTFSTVKSKIHQTVYQYYD